MSVPIQTFKIRTPLRPAGLVERPRLWARLDAGIERGWAFVCAPAGYGKTTLVASWADRRGEDEAVGWLTLDPADDDPRRLLAHLVAALPSHILGDRCGLQAVVDAPGPFDLDTIFAMLADTLAGDERSPSVLVLDDVQRLRTPEAGALLRRSIEQLRPHVRVVVVTREEPLGLRVARARVAGEVQELRADDLKLEGAQIQALLSGLGVGPLGADDLQTLTARTEGWPAGVALAAVSIRQGGREAIARLRGSDRHVADYLLEEVFADLSPSLQQFADATAVLDRLEPGVCAAVTGRDDAVEILQVLEDRALLCHAVDRAQMWFAYHPLVAEFLRWRHRGREDEVARWHRRAAAYHEGHGQRRVAFGHHRAAGDLDDAARVLETIAPSMCDGGELGTLLQWLDALPGPVVARRPRLRLEGAWARFIAGRHAETDAELDAVQRALRSDETPAELDGGGSEPEDVQELRGTAAAIRSTLLSVRGDVEGAVQASERALALLAPSKSRAIAIALSGQGVAHAIGGDLGAAERALTRCRQLLEPRVDPQKALFLTATLGDALLGQARLEDADRVYQEAVDMAADLRGHLAAMAGLAHLGRAEIAYARDRPDEAEAAYARAAELGAQWLPRGIPDLAVRSRLGRAAIERTRGRLEAADQWIAHAREAVVQGSAAARAEVAAAELALALMRDDEPTIEHWIVREIGSLAPGFADALRSASDPIVLASLQAMLRLPRARVDPLIETLEPVIEHRLQTLAAQSRHLMRLRGLASAAALDARWGRAERAQARIHEALALGHPGACLRPLLDAGSAVIHLIDRHRAAQAQQNRPLAGVPEAYLHALLAAAPIADTGSGDGAGAGLSAREQELLGLVAQGRSNREIAQALFISVGTVKRHLSNTYRKLGVGDRAAAVGRARSMGLV
ncbi:MAG: LuxR C-terminal-related transcriptional regulator [Myxococcota bacterium]